MSNKTLSMSRDIRRVKSPNSPLRHSGAGRNPEQSIPCLSFPPNLYGVPVYDFASDKITCAIFELSLFSVLLFSALLKIPHDEIKIDIKQIMISFVKKYFLG